MAHILLIEDDSSFVLILERFLGRKGHQVSAAGSLRDGRRLFGQQEFDLFLLDYRLPDGTGIEFLQHIRAQGANGPAIIMTSFNDVRTAVRAIRSGALDYITKPVNPEELDMLIREALESPTPEERGAEQRTEAAGEPAMIRGQSQAAHTLYRYIDLVAPTDMSVLLIGESGTGKEMAARSIHEGSLRKDRPFIAVDCGALSRELAASELFGHVKGAFTGAVNDKTGVFEAAGGGTLFLDEVGNLSYDVQVKLLRAIQERRIQRVGAHEAIDVDVRLLAATNEDLLQAARRGDFREDLYHRLNEFQVRLPPLREREADIDEFISFFTARANRDLNRSVERFSPGALDILYNYDWPGNLRELKNVIKRAVLLSTGPVISDEVLPEEMVLGLYTTAEPKTPTRDLKEIQEQQEKELIRKTLIEVRYNKSKAAKLLNIDRKTLYHKIKRYGLED